MPEAYCNRNSERITLKADAGGEYLTPGQARAFAEALQDRADYADPDVDATE